MTQQMPSIEDTVGDVKAMVIYRPKRKGTYGDVVYWWVKSAVFLGSLVLGSAIERRETKQEAEELAHRRLSEMLEALRSNEPTGEEVSPWR